jgi:MFS family permease
MSAAPGSSVLRGQIAPIAAITLFGLSMSMSFPLFGLLLEHSGASGTMIGINTAAAAITMVSGAPLMPLLMRRIGIGRLLIGAALLLAVMMLAMPLGSGFWYWTLLRLCFGYAGTALFFGSEYWIVAAAPEISRGRIIAIYALSVSGSMALGPVILSLTGLEGMLPFAVASAVVLAGLVPIALGLGAAPAIDGEEPPTPGQVMRVFATDPTAVFAVVLFGTIEFGAMALIAVWGVRSGMHDADAALLLTGFAVGAMVLQIPLGWAADRFDRRLVLAAIALGSALAPLGMAASGGHYWPAAFFAACWGAVSVGLYTVALTEMGARYRGAALAVGNAAIVAGYGFGALVSPGLYGYAMDTVPPNGLLYSASALATAYLVLVLARMSRARRRERNPLTPPGR